MVHGNVHISMESVDNIFMIIKLHPFYKIMGSMFYIKTGVHYFVNFMGLYNREKVYQY